MLICFAILARVGENDAKQILWLWNLVSFYPSLKLCIHFFENIKTLISTILLCLYGKNCLYFYTYLRFWLPDRLAIAWRQNGHSMISLSKTLLPNQELSGAKSELQGETVGVCSFYKRSSQPPYNSALRSLQMY